MINSKQLFKTGRETKIFEVNDKLCVNDFYNETGFTYSSLHGKMSRIQMILVDTTNGKKDKAKVLKFNFTAEEWKELLFLLKQGPDNFSKVCKLRLNTEFYGFIKVNKYKTFEKNFVEINKIKITYEKGLRKPQWKIAIESGKALPQDEGFGYISKSYKKFQDSNFMITNEEMAEILKTRRYLELWEQYSFSEFILNRNAFEKRAKDNSYNEDDLSWNKNPNIKQDENKNDRISSTNKNTNSSTNKNTNKTIKNNSKGSNDINKFICEKCGKEVDDKLATVSMKRWHKVFCTSCFNSKCK
ncbi:hypothetical protein [Clostridium baratii]|uniref:hypothetical protein n=1 Tax=Clostridium baratii TaxID=1561 RepID=UPI0005F29200|nr:hypothetical protein [Clostridium baratii]AQM58554.1 hypothetical protein NPD11_3068 [Clostridium baratii]KJU70933.1 hypothetical protein UC77_12235 [Clostridium baratii]